MADTQPIPEIAAPAAPYRPTPPEQAVLAAHLARKQTRPPAPRMRESLGDDGVGVIAFDHPKPAVAQALLMEALGTLDADFLDGLILQLAAAAIPGQKTEGLGLNFMLAMVRNVKPRDEIEAMLAAQMAALHVAAMTFARRVQPAAVARMDAAAGSFAKLARTFAAHVETLKRYRCGGEQKVTVENVTVNDGGQAVVGQAIVGQVGLGGAGLGGVDTGRENSRTTSCTGARTEIDADAPTEILRSTPCTGAVAQDRRETDAARDLEIPRTTSCTAARSEVDAGTPTEIPRSTSCTGAAAGRRKPGAYLRNFMAKNLETTP